MSDDIDLACDGEALRKDGWISMSGDIWKGPTCDGVGGGTEQTRKEWFVAQFSHWPMHAFLSVVGWLFLFLVGRFGVGSFIGGFTTKAVAFGALIAMMAFTAGLEFGQNQIKREHFPLDLYDIYDSLLDWVSWFVPLLILTILLIAVS